MGFHTITVSEDAFAAAKRVKREDESFSDYFKRAAAKQNPLERIFGMGREEGLDMKRERAEWRKRHDAMNREMEAHLNERARQFRAH